MGLFNPTLPIQMCAQYQLKAKAKSLSRALGIKISEPLEWREKIVPYSTAPVVTEDGIQMMRFSLLPIWSKEPKVKFATHNARLETIDEKATWKRPFLKHHAFVPMTAFIEPIYTGKLAGNMVAFNSEDLLFAAAICDSWTNKKTGEVIDSFSIITSNPCAYVKKVGHDRQPVFLKLKDAKEWRTLEGDAQELKEFLYDNAIKPKVKTSIDRPLKPGWEKRIK